MTTIPTALLKSCHVTAEKTFPIQLSFVSGEAWDALLEQFADASFYQTSAFGSISWGEGQLDRIALLQDGVPFALAQLRIVRIPLIKAGIAYLRWGPCCRRQGAAWEPATARRMLRALTEEYVTRRGLLLRIIPNIFVEDEQGPVMMELLGEAGFSREEEVPAYRTIRVDLTAEVDVIRKRFHGKWRNMLNSAERNNLAILEGTDDSLYGQFLQLYDEMMERKQFDTSVDANEFRRIQQQLPERQKMVIMISLKDGVPQTGLISTSVGETGIYLLGATSNEGMKSKGSYLLQWRMMNRLKERGCHWYDLGGINPDTNPGVYHFKSGMGGEECRHLGRFEHRGSFRSRLIVRTAERLRSVLNRRQK